MSLFTWDKSPLNHRTWTADQIRDGLPPLKGFDPRGKTREELLAVYVDRAEEIYKQGHVYQWLKRNTTLLDDED